MSKYEVYVWEEADEFKNLDTNETFGGYEVCELLEQKDQQILELEEQLKKSQNQKAIEELEKLKNFFLEPYRDEEMDTYFLITKDAGNIADYVLDRIKELKGEK